MALPKLNKEFNFNSFDCGIESFNNYLKKLIFDTNPFLISIPPLVSKSWIKKNVLDGCIYLLRKFPLYYNNSGTSRAHNAKTTNSGTEPFLALSFLWVNTDKKRKGVFNHEPHKPPRICYLIT